MRSQWGREEVDQKLQDIMASIYASMQGRGPVPTRCRRGANIAELLKVADAMSTGRRCGCRFVCSCLWPLDPPSRLSKPIDREEWLVNLL
jgi:hypothetical protein